MNQLLLVAAGGAVGAVLRYLASGWTQTLTDSSLPLGTLAVNLIGCLLIGLLASALAGPVLIQEEYRIALLVGLLGGFTTFSTFALESSALIGDGRFLLAAANMTISNVVGLAAVWVGQIISQRWLGA